MKQLWIALGNPLRGDDGAAHHAVELASPGPDIAVRHEIQLTPELAVLIAGAGTVVFVDAAVSGEPAIRETGEPDGRIGLTHHLAPESLVRLARELFGFRGRAFVCAVPGERFEPGGSLSGRARDNAGTAARMLADFAASDGCGASGDSEG